MQTSYHERYTSQWLCPLDPYHWLRDCAGGDTRRLPGNLAMQCMNNGECCSRHSSQLPKIRIESNIEKNVEHSIAKMWRQEW